MPGDASAPGTWRRYIYDRGPNWVRRYWGVRYMSGMLGGLFDEFQQALFDAIVGGYVQEDTQSYDALRRVGNELSMPQYATETWLQYRSRLRTAWTTWKEKAGDEDGIIEQLALAGAPGAQIFRVPNTVSEFFVFYPEGAHPVTGPGPAVGASSSIGSGLLIGTWTLGESATGTTIGPGYILGPTGITQEQSSTYRDLIQHWKPADWKAKHLLWEISGWTIGTGDNIGDAGLLLGAEHAETPVQL